METEILFKAKRTFTKDWVEGFYIKDGATHRIFEKGLESLQKGGIYSGCQVDPDSVCQFLGVFDKNGAMVFEGDRIKANVLAQGLGESMGVIEIDKEFDFVMTKARLGLWMSCEKEEDSGYMLDFNYDYQEDGLIINAFEVVGNIHDKTKQNEQ